MSRLSPLEKHLLNDFQREFPLSERPYQVIADRLGVSEEDVLLALTQLSDKQMISRIGPVIQPNQIGVSLLVAMAVPEFDLQRVADIVSRLPEINHNYEREHNYNLWFVAIAADACQLGELLQSIELLTGYQTLQLPLLDDFFIDLGFQLEWTNA